MRLQARGYEPLYIRQPTPSTQTPGIIAFCRRSDLNPLTNCICLLGRLIVSDTEISAIRNGIMRLDDKITEAVAELE